MDISLRASGRLTLREQQVMQLRREMMHPGGVRIQLRRKDCTGSIAFVDAFGAAWYDNVHFYCTYNDQYLIGMKNKYQNNYLICVGYPVGSKKSIQCSTMHCTLAIKSYQ